MQFIGGAMLQLDKVNKSFGRIQAVKNLSLHIAHGEIVGLIGPNGSGKTTTIKMIAGLYQPDSGRILIKDIDIQKEPEKTRCFIGYIPDEPAAYDKLTGEEFLHFIAESFAISPKDFSKKITELNKLFPMVEQTEGFFEDYSRGTRQKFMIMAAFLHNPPLLLIDEPIVGLDPTSANHAIGLFSDFVSDKNHSILLSTHTLPVAQKICDRFIILSHGTVIAEGTLADLKNIAKIKDGDLSQIYLKLTANLKK